MSGTTLEFAPEDPAFDQLSAAVKGAFRDLLGDRFSMRELSQEVLGGSPNRVARFVSGDRTMSFDEGMRLLAHTGTDPTLFLELVLARLPKPSPAAIVRQLCLPPDAEMDPFLVELEGLLAAPGAPALDKGSRMEELEELEELRFASAPAALLQVECICRELAADLAAGCPWKARSQHELVQALGLWATISRTLGDTASAAQGYEAAFKLAGASGDLAGEAILRKRCSFLLLFSGYSHYALKFLSQAIEFYALSNADDQLAKCLVDRGIVYMETGQPELALLDFKLALKLLPVSAYIYRVAANQWLAIRAKQLGDFSEARHWLGLAVAEFGSRSNSLLGDLLWEAGRLARKESALSEAKVKLRQALSVLTKMGEPFDAELVLLDLAEIALSQNNASEMDEIGRDLLSRLPKNRHSRKATEALIKIGNAVRFGKPTLNDFAEVRKQLKEAGAELPPPSLKYS